MINAHTNRQSTTLGLILTSDQSPCGVAGVMPSCGQRSPHLTMPVVFTRPSGGGWSTSNTDAGDKDRWTCLLTCPLVPTSRCVIDQDPSQPRNSPTRDSRHVIVFVTNKIFSLHRKWMCVHLVRLIIPSWATTDISTGAKGVYRPALGPWALTRTVGATWRTVTYFPLADFMENIVISHSK